jgi:hypothetical protein
MRYALCAEGEGYGVRTREGQSHGFAPPAFTIVAFPTRHTIEVTRRDYG